MAYTINLTNGQVFATVPDGTINKDSSQTIVGKNYAGYGEFLGENFIHLLENAAADESPTAPLTGQLWFDTTTGVLKVWNGTTFKNLGAASSESTEPDSPVIGDLWFNPTDKQLNVWTGDEWLLVGPSFTAGSGVSGAIVDVIQDGNTNDHTVVKLYVEDEIVGIISKSAEFTPASAIPGFSTIKPGIQLATNIGTETPLFEGTARNALNLVDSGGNIVPTDDFVKNNNPLVEEMLGGLLVKGDQDGIATGANGELQANVINGDAFVKNKALNKGITFQITTSSGSTDVLFVGGNGLASAAYTVDPALSPDNTLATKIYVDDAVSDGVGAITGVLKADGSVPITGNLYPVSNGAINFGQDTQRFNTVFANTFDGTAIQAKYADLAERFEIDTAMPAGTVVELGGNKEITKAKEKFSDNVFGVISTNAAYLMNAHAGQDETHPPIAMNGRVPVRVIGKVNKGDRLVSAGNGLAQSANSDKITPFNVIGRALENKETDDEGVVEAIVRIN